MNLYNGFLKKGATLKVPYKAKGEISDPNTYRGTVSECAPFKSLTTLLTNDCMPEEQFAFRKTCTHYML